MIIYGPIFMRDRPELGRRWMTAYVRALRTYNDAFGLKQEGREEVIQALVKHTAVKNRAVYDLMRPPGLDPDGALQLGGLRHDLAFWERGGLVPEPIDLARVLDTSFLDAAVRQLGPYAR